MMDKQHTTTQQNQSSDSRWAILYCPKIGKRYSHSHWEHIRQYLSERKVEYDFVQSEDVNSVDRLATMMAQNGYRRIVIVGGDSALNRALNGILSTPNGCDIELGVIPYGYMNDFARYWGFEETNYKRAIDFLIEGRIRKVDVGFVELTGQNTDANDTTNTTRRYFLNCVNIGLASDLISIQRTSHRWGVLRYFNRSLRVLFSRKQRHVHLKVNHDIIDSRVMNVCIGSCRGYGQTPNAVPYSGLLDICVLRAPRLRQMGYGLWLLASGRFLNYDGAEAHRTRQRITVDDAGGSNISLDGLIWHEADGRSFSVGLLPEHIQFIIPPISY